VVTLPGSSPGSVRGGSGMVVRRLCPVLLAVLVGVLLAVVAAPAPQVSGMAWARATDTVKVKDCFGQRISLKRAEYRMLRLHNEARTKRDLKRLCVHPKLQRAAREHSRDMIEKDYFSHYSRDGKEDPGERLHRYGYDWSAYGENIAWGQGTSATPEKIFDHWMAKSVHRKQILSKRYREAGIGTVTGLFTPEPGQEYPDASMWTVDLGSRG
jgi:uncharacterized protein YkwD